jgi:hypothetical protein
MPETTPPARESFVNQLLDNRLSTTTTRVSNSAAQATKTTNHPSGSQQKGK